MIICQIEIEKTRIYQGIILFTAVNWHYNQKKLAHIMITRKENYDSKKHRFIYHQLLHHIHEQQDQVYIYKSKCSKVTQREKSLAQRGTELIVVTITLHAKNLDLYTQLEFSIITSNPLLLALSLSRRYCPCLSFTSPKKYLMKKTGLIGVMYHHAQKQA